jgi:glycosyltransferase involved in cell wall biosynthesis
VKLSVCIIALNEEANIGRTLKSVQPLIADGEGEIVVVDSGSTDRTVEIAKSFGAKVFTEPWKGFAAQKNSAIEKAQGEWILSLDADEEVGQELQQELMAIFLEFFRYSGPIDFPEAIRAKLQATEPGGELLPVVQKDLETFFDSPDQIIRRDAFVAKMKKFRYLTKRDDLHASMRKIKASPFYDKEQGGGLELTAFWMPRKNHFLGRWIRHGGFYPDRKLRLFRKGQAVFQPQLVHETVLTDGMTMTLRSPLIHHAYPTISGYIEHMNKYSSLGAEMEIEKGRRGFSLINIGVRPWLTFIYNYFFRLGFLDGKEGLLLHTYHAVYVSWKYAKVWELSRSQPESRKNAAP